jgi:predicted nuclease of predicted toxin-antitoxin system
VSLLFDENLSPRLIRRLEAAYPQSEHVELVGLKGQSDLELWEYAARHGATLVSKDNDFRQLSFLRGHPPKVIWLNVGNAGTDAIAELLAAQRERVQAFLSDPEASLLILDLPMQERG